MRAQVVAGCRRVDRGGSVGRGGVVDSSSGLPCELRVEPGSASTAGSRSAGRTYSVDWYLPNRARRARSCSSSTASSGSSCVNLRGTSAAVMEQGVMVAVPQRRHDRRQPCARAVRSAICSPRARSRRPAGKALPESYIVGGHSAEATSPAWSGHASPKSAIAALEGSGAVRPGCGRRLHRQPPGDLRRGSPARPLGRVAARRSPTCSTTASAR